MIFNHHGNWKNRPVFHSVHCEKSGGDEREREREEEGGRRVGKKE